MDEITREEYNAALDIIDEYHRQLNEKTKINTNGLSVMKLVSQPGVSIRLYNVMRACDFAPNGKVYVGDINREDFTKTRMAGQLCWYEFIKLRGY